MTGYTDPAVKDETARILKELERIISEDCKQGRDIVRTEYTELKRKVTEYKNEKIEFIDQLESEKKAKISSLTTTYNGLRIAQDCSKKEDIDITQKFLALEKDLNRIRNSIMSQKINIEFHKDKLSDPLKLFCVLNYGLPPGTQTIPSHDAPIEKPLQQQPADLPEKGDSSIDDFIRFVHTFKTLDLKPTLYSEIPIEIVNQSKQYVKYMNKYTLVKCYEIMRSSIQNGKLMNNVCTGFANLSKLANCIYFDPNSEETRIIQVDSVFYQDIRNNLCNTDDVFQLLGYENKRQFWQLDNVSVSKFEARIERVFCELCLAVQESNAVEKQVPANSRLNFLTQMVEKSAKPGLPLPLPLPNSKPKPKEQEAAQTLETLEDDDDQYALSELQVAIDSVQTFDPKYTPSLAEAKPDDLFEEAQKCVRLPTKTKYQLIQMYDVIKSNLLANKTIQDIIQGLTGAFKYAYCQLFDLKSDEIQELLYNEDPFLSLVSSKMVCYLQVFLSMGYTPLVSGLGMILNNPERHNSSLVCCELLIGIQEMTELERTGHDPMKYFNLLKPASRENLDVAHQQTVQPEKHPPLVQIQHRNIPDVAPQQATNVSPGSMEMQTASKDLPAPKSHGHMPTPQTFPPTNFERRQQHGSGQMPPPPNQGSAPIEPMPTPQTFPPTNIERRQQHGSGQMKPPNQGSAPIEPMPTPQTFPPTNIERRQQHGSGQMLPPNQGSGPIEPMPTPQTFPPTNIEKRQQHGSGQMPPPPNQGSAPIEPMPTPQTFPPTNIERRQQHGSGQMKPPNQGSAPIEPMPTPQTFPPTNIERRQQHGSGQMKPPNQGSGPIEPMPTPQTFPPTNIERRQQHGSGQMLPPNQGSAPIEPMPTPQTFPPTNIERRQQHGSGQMLPPPNQGSGPIEPMPTTRTYASPNIEPMQHASGPGQPYQTHGSQMQPKQTPGEPSTVTQTFNPGTIETSRMNKQNVSGQRGHHHDPSRTVNPHEPTQVYDLPRQSPYPVSTQSNTGYSNVQDPSMGSSPAHGQGGKPPYGYKQGDLSQSHQSQNVPPHVQPSSAQNLHVNRSQEISQSSDPNRQDNSPKRTQSGRLYAFEGQHPSFILLQDFENVHNMCPNFQLVDKIPAFLVDLARNCLQFSAKDKYSNDLVGEIILANLRSSIAITEICQGIEWLAKYCMCIYLRQPYTEVAYLKVGGCFNREIESRIRLPTELYAFLGYVFNKSDNIYHLEIEKIDVNTVVQIGCDCLIAIQDLNEYKDIGHEKFILFFEQYEPISTYGNMVLSQQAVSQAQDPSMLQYQPNPHQAQSIAPYAGMNIQSQQPFPKPNETFAQGGLPYGQSYQPPQHNYPMPVPGSQTEMKRWSCPHCTYSNPGNKSICEKCSKSNNFNTEIPFEVSTARQSTAIKYCDKCTHPNRMQDVNCVNCRSSIIHSMQ